MSSGRLFRSDCLSAFMMRSFSVRHRSHLFDSLVYGCAWLAMYIATLRIVSGVSLNCTFQFQ